ncbi:heme/hemin ABC transporter substrate-binding protein [Sediminitomix flava]|uniref:Iron complex transport system substrate-binding protein n=1 Tax=Sediminitomix flava TaxID=379075 RepID=A0A315ZGM3_SEDFL|nr:ABC transporter substrate-binding protein [Sediminitomix flava]PWJ44309.1 iron complex transport system substrate-binding protein [Sediminitomix flava]
MQKTIFSILVSLIAILVVSCSAKTSEKTNEQVDGEQNVRIVSIGGQVTEVIAALGFANQIVARDITSTYPEEVLKSAVIGHVSKISAEGILAHNPDQVWVAEEGMKAEVIAQLQEAGINIITYSKEKSVNQLYELIGQVAQELKVEEKGAQLIEKVKTSTPVLASNEKAQKPKVLMVYARGRGAMHILGKETFAEEILALAGAELAVTDVVGYKKLTPEALIAANPDYLMFFESGLESLGGMEGVLTIPGVAETTAGKKKQIIAMDGAFVSGFGPRIGEAIQELATKLQTIQ